MPCVGFAGSLSLRKLSKLLSDYFNYVVAYWESNNVLYVFNLSFFLREAISHFSPLSFQLSFATVLIAVTSVCFQSHARSDRKAQRTKPISECL